MNRVTLALSAQSVTEGNVSKPDNFKLGQNANSETSESVAVFYAEGFKQ